MHLNPPKWGRMFCKWWKIISPLQPTRMVVIRSQLHQTFNSNGLPTKLHGQHSLVLYFGDLGLQSLGNHAFFVWRPFRLWYDCCYYFLKPCFIFINFAHQFVAALLALIYKGQTITDADDIMNINGALFILLTNATFQNVYAVVNVCIAIFLEYPKFIIFVSWMTGDPNLFGNFRFLPWNNRCSCVITSTECNVIFY